MTNLETLAKQVADNPPASLTPMAEIERRVSRRRVRNRAKLGGAAIVFIAASFAAFTTLGSPDADNTVAVTPTTTSTPDSTTTQQTEPAEPTTAPSDPNQWTPTPGLLPGEDTLLDNVFGRPLSTTVGVWPNGGLPYDELMESFATDVLNWPDATWDPILEEGGLTVARLRSDDSANATELLLSLEPGPNGWIVSSSLLSGGADMRLENESLVAFSDTRFGANTATVEAYRWDGAAQWATAFAESSDWAPTMTLPRPIPAIELGPYLAIGRDPNGAAIDLVLFNGGFPERLTLDLDSVFEGLPPSELPDWLYADDPSDGALDYANVRVLTGMAGDLYITPTTDRAGIDIRIVVSEGDQKSAAGTGAGASRFNQLGVAVSSSGPGYSNVWYLIPDSVTIGDVGDAQVDATGRFVWIDGSDLSQLAVIDGVLVKTN